MIITFKALPPAEAKLLCHVTLEVPEDSGKEDDLVLRCVQTGDTFESRVSEAHPAITSTLHLRLAVFVHGLVGHAVAQVAKVAADSLRRVDS